MKSGKNMSRTGLKPIKIPTGVDVNINEDVVSVKGPKGELSMEISSEIEVKINDGEIVVSERRKTKKSKALWGTTRAVIANMVFGVSSGYLVELQIKGVGYRAELQENKLVFRVGFSHSVELSAPEGVEFAIEKDIIKVSGIKKDLVGRVAAQIRKIRPPEPYKGKGIRYKDEVVILKEGKKGVGK